MFKIDDLNSSGKSTLLIILGIIIVVIIILVVVVTLLRSSEEPEPVIAPVKGEMPELVQEVVVGDIKFAFVEAEDIGNFLRCEDRIRPPSTCRSSYDLKTTDKFIKVKITAQNVGQDSLRRRSWDIKELVDSEGRKFYSAGAKRWISGESQCGEALKPGFTPTSCIEIYEVAKPSIGLKLRVFADADKSKAHYIDLGLYNEKYCWNDADCGCGINKYTNDCFVGNKTYVTASDPLVYPPELIEECNNFCAIGTEGSAVECLENECSLFFAEPLPPPPSD